MSVSSFLASVTATNHSSSVQVVEITAAKAVNIVLQRQVITPPEAVGLATGTAFVWDRNNRLAADIECHAVLVQGNGAAGHFRSGRSYSATSNAEGVVEWTRLAQGATYRFYVGEITAAAPFVEVQVPNQDQFHVGELVS